MPLDAEVLNVVEQSLDRCGANPVFLDRFYEVFLASSPKVLAMFEHTNFYRQKRALQASLHGMLLHARADSTSSDPYLVEVAQRHDHTHLNIGAELYDLWLDSLLATVKECDPNCTPNVLAAWEQAMTLGIQFFLSHY